MSAIAASAEVERFRTVIARRLGLQFGDARSGFLGELLGRRIHHSGGQAQTYLDRLNAAPQRAEIAALARELTVGETYFFRHREQFLALRETVLPDRMRANARARSLHLLSAGCASGEEAYSLAMLMRDAVAEPGWDIAIRAVDLNPAALAKARRARYSPWALRETPPELRARWFSTVGNELLLDESVRDTVCFVASNLAEDDAAVWRPACFDVVLCRNVLMYFAPAALDPDGLLAAARRADMAEAAAVPERRPVLVVDDSLTTRMLEQSILEAAGYEVDVAVSAEEALEVAHRKRYALFLVDVEMPGMDGFGFVERVGADPALRDIPAVLVTSRAAPEDRQRGREVGARGYIVKGEFDQRELLSMIRPLVGQR